MPMTGKSSATPCFLIDWESACWCIPLTLALPHEQIGGKLMCNAPHAWADENGQPIAIENTAKMLAPSSEQPIFQYVLASTSEGRYTTWLSINVLPVFSENGSVRRILLTLTDINEERNPQSEIEQFTTRDPLTGVFNQRHVMVLLEKRNPPGSSLRHAVHAGAA